MTIKSVAIAEFKAHCLALLEEVAQTGETILVTKRGRPLARITPSATGEVVSPQETLHGTVEILGDVVSPALPIEAWSSLTGQSRKRRTRKVRRK